MIEFRILGPLEVQQDGRAVDLGGPRRRVLLAVLLLRTGEPVPADVLAQALWGDDVPPTAGKALQVQVSRLRRALGPAADRLETAGGGYRLVVETGELDAARFERACASARSAADLGDALAIWRGPALADLRYEAVLQPEILRLEELRAVTLEERVEAELALGGHARLAGELGALVAEHPLRERLRGQQMLALYRAGRHADALAAYRDARMALDAELGLEPGPELRRLEQAILTHDPSLAPPAAAHGPPAPPTPTFGREDDVRAILALLADARLVTLTGPGGVGKTRLAVEVARAAGGRFAALAPVTDAERVPAAICDALAVARIPGETDRDALDRALGRAPMLLVADKLEHLPGSGAVLAGLLDDAPELTILATSREPLHVKAERRYPVSPLAPDGAEALFADRARARDPAFAPTAAVAEICRRVDGLPLAIELAAARLGLLDPDELAARLDDALAMLDQGPHDAPKRQRTMRATLDWSFDLLEEAERDAFTALGAFVGGCDLDAAEAVTLAAVDVLEGLVAKSLVTIRDGRLTMLEPVRQYAAERLAARAGGAAIRGRHFAHYLALAEASEPEIWALQRGGPAFARLRREHDNLRAAAAWGLRSGMSVDVLRLASAVCEYGWFSHSHVEVKEWIDRAYADVDGMPPLVRAHAELCRAKQRPGTDRRPALDTALALFRQIRDEETLVRSLIDISQCTAFDGDYGHARAVAEEALELARPAGDDAQIGAALGAVALGSARVEVPLVREAGAHLRAAGATERRAQVFSTAGMAALSDDAYDVSEQLGLEALADALAIGDPWTIAFVQGNLGLATLLGGRYDHALAAFRAELGAARHHGLAYFYFEGLLGLAALAAADGADERAAILEATAWEAIDRPVATGEAPVYERVDRRFIAPARKRLGEVAWRSAQATGRNLGLEAALALALEPALLPQ